MTPATTYMPNGQPARVADGMAGGDAGMCAVEQLPSGALLASCVDVTGP